MQQGVRRSLGAQQQQQQQQHSSSSWLMQTRGLPQAPASRRHIPCQHVVQAAAAAGPLSQACATMQQQQQQVVHHPQQLLHKQQHRLQRSAAMAAAVQLQPRPQPRSTSGSSQHLWHAHHHIKRLSVSAAAAAAADGADSIGEQQQQQQQQQLGAKAIPPRIQAAADQETYSLKDTQVLVETAMLSAVSGLAFLLSTLLKLDNSLGYFLPLPITIAACRSGPAAAWHTMMATAFLLLVLLGPLRAMTYVLMHGVLAASLGSVWVWKWPWQISIPAGAVLRMSGQLGYLVLSSLTMNENLFSVMLANVHNLLDQLSAALGSYGSPSTLAITSMIFALLLVNGICYVFLLHVVYHVILGSMGFKLGALPGFVRKYLYAGVPQQQQQQAAQ